MKASLRFRSKPNQSVKAGRHLCQFYGARGHSPRRPLTETTRHVEYDKWAEDNDPDELDEALVDSGALGATRFDRILRQLRSTDENRSDRSHHAMKAAENKATAFSPAKAHLNPLLTGGV